jgi:hypothetical protein
MPNATSTTIRPLEILFASFRALVPNLLIDIGGTTAVYYALLPHFGKSSPLPLIISSLVPIVSVALNAVRHRKIDVIAIIVLLGLLGGISGFFFGGGQKLLLVRESFFTGLAGLALFASPMFRNPIGYYVVSHFMTTHQPHESGLFERLWESPAFRRTIHFITYFWGLLLLTEFGLRVFMALALPVVFVLTIGPLVLNAMMLAGGAISAVSFSRALRTALS